MKIIFTKDCFLYILEDQERLCALTAELVEYCNSQKSPLAYRPKTGDACCAKYTGKIPLGKVLKGKDLVLSYVRLCGFCCFRSIFPLDRWRN